MHEGSTDMENVSSCIIVDNETQGKQTFSIAVFSENSEYKYTQIHQPTLQKIINTNSEKTRFLLGYSSDNINAEPIPSYQHRAFIVSQGLRCRYKEIGTDLYTAHNRLKEHKKEITISPSLLSFYIKKGYEITKIYIPMVESHTENEKGNINSFYPEYDIDTPEKKNKIYSIIKAFLESGDIWLPFFVCLEKKDTSGGNYSTDYIQEMKQAFSMQITIGTVMENKKCFLLQKEELEDMLGNIGLNT